MREETFRESLRNPFAVMIYLACIVMLVLIVLSVVRDVA